MHMPSIRLPIVLKVHRTIRAWAKSMHVKIYIIFIYCYYCYYIYSYCHYYYYYVLLLLYYYIYIYINLNRFHSKINLVLSVYIENKVGKRQV